MRDLKYIIGPMRAPFLALPPACVLLGVATAIRAVGHVLLWQVALVLIGAVTAHISVNALNEYCDCHSGLDARTTRTPFSGGSGVLPAHPEMARVALATGLVSMGITAGIGIFFLLLHGWALLPLGLLGLCVIAVYTPWLTRQPALCLIAPGLGFGTVMVVGTQVALTGHYTLEAWLVSLVPFFLVNNLLLLNQFPDIEADRSVGRQHVLIVRGAQFGSVIYAIFLAAAYLVIIAGVLWVHLPWLSLLALATLLLAIPAARGALRYNADIPRLTPYLGMNVVINLATPVLLAVGMLVGR
jgi:1,4-dihydroxy-2-naphthoate octaprenyltransferase